jgi:hypothetical protein
MACVCAAPTPNGALSAGRTAAPQGEESPGSMEARCRVTPGEGDLRESATESKPPRFAGVRVKGCGKSAPRVRQRTWQGKPHREQNLIGTARALPRSRLQICRPGWLLEASGNGCPRGMAVAQGSNPALQNPAYRPADINFPGFTRVMRGPCSRIGQPGRTDASRLRCRAAIALISPVRLGTRGETQKWNG